MFEHVKCFIFSLPEEECKAFYCELVGEDCCNNSGNNEGYKWHIYSKLRYSIRWHRYKGKVNERTTKIVMKILYWLDIMSEKYSMDWRHKNANNNTK